MYDFDGSSNGKGEIRIYARTLGGVFRQRNSVITDTGDEDFIFPLKFPEKTDIEIRGLADTGTNKMSATFSMVLK
jgi:hypothetical protein